MLITIAAVCTILFFYFSFPEEAREIVKSILWGMIMAICIIIAIFYISIRYMPPIS